MEHVHMDWLGLRNYRFRFGDSGKSPLQMNQLKMKTSENSHIACELVEFMK